MERYKKILGKDEKVVWYQTLTKQTSNFTLWAFVIGLCIFFLIASTNQPKAFKVLNDGTLKIYDHKYAFHIIISIFTFIGLLISYRLEKNICITNKRIIIESFFIYAKKKYIYFNELTNVYAKRTEITITSKKKTDKLTNVYGLVAQNVILKHWNPKRYKEKIIDQLESFATTYNLNYESDFTPRKEFIKIKGEIKNIPAFIHISGNETGIKFEIDFKINNPQNNTLYIQPENMNTNLGKIVGKQDLKVGSKDFDKYYLIQSNHEAFMNFVFTKDLREKILGNHLITGTLQLGDIQQLKTKEKSDNTILDDVIIQEKKNLRPNMGEHSNTLSYRHYFTKKREDRAFLLEIREPREILDIVIEIATRVNGYR